MINSAIYLKKEIDKFIDGLITIEELTTNLHFIIDDVTIRDAIYDKERKIEGVDEKDYYAMSF
jgi:hypothetical protein